MADRTQNFNTSEYDSYSSLDFLMLDKEFFLSLGHKEEELKRIIDTFFNVELLVKYDYPCRYNHFPKKELIHKIGRSKFMSYISHCAAHGWAYYEDNNLAIRFWYPLKA